MFSVLLKSFRYEVFVKQFRYEVFVLKCITQYELGGFGANTNNL